MPSSNNNIIKSLNLTPITVSDRKVITAPQSDSQDVEAESDIQNAREGLYKALGYSKDTVEELIDIARQSQHPKAYEILNQAIKTLADISSELGTIQLKKQRIMKRGDADENGDTHNHLYITTADLQKMLEQAKENKKQDEE